MSLQRKARRIAQKRRIQRPTDAVSQAVFDLGGTVLHIDVDEAGDRTLSAWGKGQETQHIPYELGEDGHIRVRTEEGKQE